MHRTHLTKNRPPVALHRRGWPHFFCEAVWRGRAVAAGLVALLTQVATAGTTSVAPPAGYSDLSLEQLMNLKVERVYGASRHEQKVTDAPSSVSIVTADEIHQFGWRTLADILRSVRGFYASDDRNYTYLGTRGFQRPGDYNTRVLLLIDGHRMNDNVYDGAYFGRESMIATDAIERVEVIRGPSSSIYGSSAFFGVINIVTKRGSEVTTDIGTHDSYEGRFAFNHTFHRDLEGQLSGSYYTSAGEKRLYFPEFDQRVSRIPGASNNGVAENADREDASHLFSSLSYHDLTFSAFLSRRTKEVPTASYGTLFNDGRERTADRRGYLDVKLDRAFADHRLLGRVFYDQYRYNGQYPDDHGAPGGLPDVVLDADGTVGEWLGTEWQFNARLSPKHAASVGVEFRESLREYQFNFLDNVRVLDDRRRSRNLGVFGQWEFAPRRDLLLSTGLRYDHYYGSFGGTLNPRIALIYSPTTASTLKLLYGEAFRAPNPYERFYNYHQSFVAALRPERIRTRELVYERYWGPVYRATFSIYTYDVDRLISQMATAADDLFFANADSTRARGAEVEFEATIGSGWLAR